MRTPTNGHVKQDWLSAAMIRAGDRLQVVHMGGVGSDFGTTWRLVTRVELHQPSEDYVTVFVARSSGANDEQLIYTPERLVQVRRAAAVAS